MARDMGGEGRGGERKRGESAQEREKGARREGFAQVSALVDSLDMIP